MLTFPPDLRQVVDEWEFAVAAGDIPAMMALCTEDVEVLVSRVQTVVGSADVAGMFQIVFSRQQLHRVTRPRSCHQDHNLAVLSSDVDLDVSTDPALEPTRILLREVAVLRREADVWKIALMITNMVDFEPLV